MVVQVFYPKNCKLGLFFICGMLILESLILQYPTKALAPLMLEDYRKVMVERRGEEEQFTSDHIAECMKKGKIPVTTINFLYCNILNDRFLFSLD